MLQFPLLEYCPCTSELKERFSDQHLRVFSTSLFRPKKRNLRAREYSEKLLKIAQEFETYFHGWILRVYYDESLFSCDYIYDNDQCHAGEEVVLWNTVLDELKVLPYVQLVKFTFPELQHFDQSHHIGYLGTIARFFSFFDQDVGVTITRDIDSDLVEKDREQIDLWLASPLALHAYKQDDYFPLHRPKLFDNNKCFCQAGLFGAKEIQNKVALWNALGNSLSVFKASGASFTYGIDEILLNETIVPMLGYDTLKITPLESIQTNILPN